MHLHTRQGAHRRLHRLGRKHIGRVGRTHNVLNPPPIGDANDRAHVTGVLHSVECQTEVVCGRGKQGLDGGSPRLFENGQHALWRALLGNARQLIGRDIDPLADVKIIQRQIRQLTGFADQQAAAKIGQKIGHELPPFGQEEPLGIAIFLAIETAYEFLFVFAEHEIAASDTRKRGAKVRPFFRNAYLCNLKMHSL